MPQQEGLAPSLGRRALLRRGGRAPGAPTAAGLG